MNNDEVRVNISRVLIAEMINVGNTDKHTHTHTHTFSRRSEAGMSLWLCCRPAQLGNCGDSVSSVLGTQTRVLNRNMPASECASLLFSLPVSALNANVSKPL